MSEGPGRAPVSDERCRMFLDTERVIPGLACITVPASHEIISLEEYTAIALTEFGFTDADTLLLKFIHDAVYKEGEIGLPLLTLQVSKLILMSDCFRLNFFEEVSENRD